MGSLLVLTVASAAAGVFAVSRFIASRAYRSYPWFVVYLSAGALQSLGWLFGEPSDHRYIWFYACSMALLLALRIAIVVELWNKLVPSYERAALLSRSAVWAILAAALAVSAASGFDTLRFFGLPANRLAFHTISFGVRYSGSALCVICSCLALFTVLFPRDVPQNAVRHALLLTAYFATIAAGFLAMHYVRGSAELVGALMTGSSAGLYVLWGMLVSAPGERAAAALSAFAQAG